MVNPRNIYVDNEAIMNSTAKNPQDFLSNDSDISFISSISNFSSQTDLNNIFTNFAAPTTTNTTTIVAQKPIVSHKPETPTNPNDYLVNN